MSHITNPGSTTNKFKPIKGEQGEVPFGSTLPISTISFGSKNILSHDLNIGGYQSGLTLAPLNNTNPGFNGITVLSKCE